MTTETKKEETKKAGCDAFKVIDERERVAVCVNFSLAARLFEPQTNSPEAYWEAYMNLYSCITTILDGQSSVCLKKEDVMVGDREMTVFTMQSIPDITREEIISNWETIKQEILPSEREEENIKGFDWAVSLLRAIPLTLAKLELSWRSEE